MENPQVGFREETRGISLESEAVRPVLCEVGCGGRWEGGSDRGDYVYLWLIHVDTWQKPIQYCKAIVH